MESLLYDKLPNKSLQCHVCEHHCVIKEGKRGFCGVRENIMGKLLVLNYGKCVAKSIDPIEKKPLYHFLPNTNTYSFSTVGCNMDCKWCQNHTISQQPKPNHHVYGESILPLEHINYAIKTGCPSISYTYTEPTIFIEYAYQTMKQAHKFNLKNIWVSNGYMSKESLEHILPYLDAINVDIKGSEEVYQSYCAGGLDQIYRNLKTIHNHNVHIELTTLVIPEVNDDINEIIKIAKQIQSILGLEIPWHITRFHPTYKMKHHKITPKETLLQIQQTLQDMGFKYIYLGNI